MRNKFSHVPELKAFRSPAGSRFKEVLEPRFNGRKVVLEKVGTMDIQERIEAFAPYTDLNYMLHRLKVGDTSVLRSSNPLYGDFSNLPTNPLDAVNLVHSAEQAFVVLPVEEKQKYNNDYRVWLATLFASGGNPSNGTPSNPAANPVSVEPTSTVNKEE